MRRGALVTAIALLAVVSAPSHASADADPASDYLPNAPVFYPYQAAVAPALRDRLERTLARLRAKGLNLKVAVILNPFDLGAVHVLFGRPRLYAKLLDYEISFGHPQPLLVVMRAGFGIEHVGATSALRGVAMDKTDQATALSAARPSPCSLSPGRTGSRCRPPLAPAAACHRRSSSGSRSCCSRRVASSPFACAAGLRRGGARTALKLGRFSSVMRQSLCYDEVLSNDRKVGSERE